MAKDAGADRGGVPGLGSAGIVHELANLLDGSLRHIGLAISDLNQLGVGEDHRTQEVNDTLDRLSVAHHAMNQMATLLHDWMRKNASLACLHDSTQTLKQAVQQAVRLVAPAALEQQITIGVSLADNTASLPAGPVGTIFTNALRNSIQAIASAPVEGVRSPADGWFIELGVRLTAGGDVELYIQDNGPGLDPAMIDGRGRLCVGQTTKPAGHGVGLVLVCDIAQSLGGVMQLENCLGSGARLTVRYPQGPIKP